MVNWVRTNKLVIFSALQWAYSFSQVKKKTTTKKQQKQNKTKQNKKQAKQNKNKIRTKEQCMLTPNRTTTKLNSI
jgi:hypothetical protein